MARQAVEEKVVCKVELHPDNRYYDLHLGARIVHVAFKPNGLRVWYETSLENFNSAQREAWSFIVVSTNEPIECPYPYLGTGLNFMEVCHVYGGKFE